jgi:hypothetical protein
MPVTRGGDIRITAIKRGATALTSIKRGTVTVWQASLLRDDFNEDRGIGLGSNWFDHGTALTPHLISVNNESYARINLPDGVGVITGKTSRMRYLGGISTTDDGYVEVRVATRGDWENDFETIAYSHLSDGAFTHGVGISLRASSIRIVSMVAGGVRVDRASAGSFQPGDVIRLVHSNGGNVHQIYKNGILKATWNDSTNIASRGAGFRSYGIQMYGRKDSIFTPRRYSPGLDYIEAGGGDFRVRPMATANDVRFNTRTPRLSFPKYVAAKDDLLLVGVATTEFVSGGHVDPPGWTTVGHQTSDANVGRIVYHQVTQAEADAGQTSWSLGNYLNNSTQVTALAAVFRSVDPTNPIDAITSTFSSANLASPHIFPAIPGASLSNRSLVVGFVCADGGPTYGSPPAGWEMLARGGAGSVGRVMCVRTVLTQSGVDVLAAEIVPNIPDEFVGFSVALTEAPTG